MSNAKQRNKKNNMCWQQELENTVKTMNANCKNRFIKGVVQDYFFKLISFDQRQLCIAREKLRISPYACLHIDITGNFVNRWYGEEVYNTVCLFRGFCFICLLIFCFTRGSTHWLGLVHSSETIVEHFDGLK